MSRYALGQPIRLTTTVSDINGSPADPTDLSLTLVAGDGTTTTYAYNPGDIVRDGVGVFHLDLTSLTDVGHYTYAWVSTGSNAGVGPVIGAFDVYSPYDVQVVSIEDARRYLRLIEGSSVTADDLTLADIIGSVTAGLVRLVGPFTPTTYTEVLCASGTLRLSYVPVQSLTSVTALFTAPTVAVADLTTLPGGVVVATAPSFLNGWYRVVYVAGPETVPSDVRGAALDWVLHRWRQSQAHSSATYGELVPDFRGPPNAVLNQIRHYMVDRSGI